MNDNNTNEDPTTNFWVITHGNDVPYAYVTAANWIKAQEEAEQNAEVQRNSTADKGYGIRRMRASEVAEARRKGFLP